MQRTLEPELLDALPPDHPDALHNRRDLRVINQIVGSHRWLKKTLRRLVHRGELVLELEVAEDDMGRVIGKSGKLARAMRNLLHAVGSKTNQRYELEILE